MKHTSRDALLTAHLLNWVTAEEQQKDRLTPREVHGRNSRIDRECDEAMNTINTQPSVKH